MGIEALKLASNYTCNCVSAGG